ncbi:hypothetical protein BsWGS_27273 [Bradybaena similaris]
MFTTIFSQSTDRRLSRKRSHVSIDRLRRSMSLETCRVDSPGKNQPDAATERQTNSLKCRINPPETIIEEEIERIRRESLIPRVGLLASSGRRKFSVVVDSVSTALNSSMSAGAISTNSSEASTDASSPSTMTSIIPASSVSTSKSTQKASGPQKPHIPEDNDEEFGEIFDRKPAINDFNSRTGVLVNVMELYTLQTKGQGVTVDDSISGISSLEPPKVNKIKGVRDSQEDEFDGLSFTAPIVPDENDNDSNGIDPLAFLTEEQARRVTFM